MWCRPITGYQIEWDTVAFQEETQTLSLKSAPASPVIRTLTTDASVAAEIQFVTVVPAAVGTASAAGTFTLTLRGLTTQAILFSASDADVDTAIELLGALLWVSSVL